MLKNTKFLIFFSFLNLSACYWNTSGVNTMFSLPSVGSEYTPADYEIFYVDLDVDTYESNGDLVPYYEISTTEEYGDSVSRESPSNCEVEYVPYDEDSTDRNATETKICIMDVPEYEFAVKELHLVYNIPDGMCEIVSVALPWHFNFRIKPGPVVKECSFARGEETLELLCPNDCGDESRCHEEEERLCLTDGTEAPRCCYGGEKTDGSIWIPEEACFGGPGPFVRGGFSDFKKPHLLDVDDLGLKQTISFESLVNINLNRFNSHANYLKILDRDPSSTSVQRSDLPKFLQNTLDSDDARNDEISFYKYTPRLFFQFRCLDSSSEVIHELLLMIREWNTFEEYWNFSSVGGNDDSDPDVTGYEGDECEYETRGAIGDTDEECNDVGDMDDIEDYPMIDYDKEDESS